jgi:hypothetical protein
MHVTEMRTDWEGSGAVIGEDQRLASELAEVDDHVGPLGIAQQQRLQFHRFIEEPTICTDLCIHIPRLSNSFL